MVISKYLFRFLSTIMYNFQNTQNSLLDSKEVFMYGRMLCMLFAVCNQGTKVEPFYE